MAEIRPSALNVTSNLPAAPRGSAKAEAVRAAQAAFFQAALQQAPAPARPAAVAAAPSAAPRGATGRVSFDAQAEPPTRILRPGSLVDLKV